MEQVLEAQRSDSVSLGASLDDGEIGIEIRSLYRSLLFDNPQVVQAKNIDSLLWKKCFHRKIEESRKGIKKMTALLDATYTERRSGGVAKSFSQYRAEERLLQLNRALESFLALALSFYQGVCAEFETRSNAALQQHRDVEAAYASRQVHLSCLYMGDLARYSELHAASSKQKDWSVAARYYERARRVMPDSGNPHNQVRRRVSL